MNRKIMAFFIRIYYWLMIVVLSLKWVPKINLGDIIIYQGKRYFVANGVCAPSWDIQLVGGFERLLIHQSKFKKECTLKNFMGSFKSGYRFYMTSWYSIWCHSGIEPWMKACNIWAK